MEGYGFASRDTIVSALFFDLVLHDRDRANCAVFNDGGQASKANGDGLSETAGLSNVFTYA